MDSGLGTLLKCSKQIPENTWFEENYAQNVLGWNNLTFPNTSVRYLKLRNKIAERTCRTAPHYYSLIS